MRSISLARAVRKMIGTVERVRMVLQNSKPLPSGRPMSSTTRAKACATRAASPA